MAINKKPKSIDIYHNFVFNISEYIELTFQEKIEDAVTLINQSNRIFLIGKGSSSIAINFLSQQLGNIFPHKRIEYIAEYKFIEKILMNNDLVILNSYSAKTNDAKYTIKQTLAKKTKLLLITANEEQKAILSNRISIIEIFPKKEKLFSRPASLITAYTLACRILNLLQPKTIFFKNDFLSIFKEVSSFDEIIKNINKHEFISVLYSGFNQPFAMSLSLALNEGVGKQSCFYNIDEYLHGWWVPAFKQSSKNMLFVLNNRSNNFEYAQSFLKDSKMVISSFEKSSQNIFYDGANYLWKTIQLIDQYNQKYNYNMNDPIGKSSIKKIY